MIVALKKIFSVAFIAILTLNTGIISFAYSQEDYEKERSVYYSKEELDNTHYWDELESSPNTGGIITDKGSIDFEQSIEEEINRQKEILGYPADTDLSKDINLAYTIDSRMQDTLLGCRTLKGVIVYGTGYDPIVHINYKAGGSTDAEIQYFKDGAIAIAHIDQIKRKGDVVESFMFSHPIDSGHDDESMVWGLDNRYGTFGGISPGIGHKLELTHHKGEPKNHIYEHQTIPLSKALYYQLFFNGIGTTFGDYDEDSDYEKHYEGQPFKLAIGEKLNWYDLSKDSLFKDVENDYYAMRAINKCSNLGLMTGVTKDTFNPEANLTKAEWVQILYNVYKKAAKNIKKPTYNKPIAVDVPVEAPYFEALNWGLINGFIRLDKDKHFNPDTDAPLEVVYVSLYKLAKKEKIGLPNWRGKIENNYSFDRPDYYKYCYKTDEISDALFTLHNAEIIDGQKARYSMGCYEYCDNISRAKTAILIDNFMHRKYEVDSGRYLPQPYN